MTPDLLTSGHDLPGNAGLSWDEIPTPSRGLTIREARFDEFLHVELDAPRVLPADLCRLLGVLPLAVDDRTITVASSDPDDELAQYLITSMSGILPPVRLDLVLAGRPRIDAAIGRVFGPAADGAGAEDATASRARQTVIQLLAPPEAPGRADEPRMLAEPPAAPQAPSTPAKPPGAIDTQSPPAPAPGSGVTPAPAPSIPEPGTRLLRIGELLIARGLLDSAALDDALVEQSKSGGRLGAILTHSGRIPESVVVNALSAQLEMPVGDIAGVEPDADALALVPLGMARRYRVVPLAIEDGALTIAMQDPLDEDAIAALSREVAMPLRALVASDTTIDLLLQRLGAQDDIEVAVRGLIERRPEESAARVVTQNQRRVFWGIGIVGVVALIATPLAALIAFNFVAALFYVMVSTYKFLLAYDSLDHENELKVSPEEIAALDERKLPTFTVLVPLYREAAVVAGLTEAIAQLDYPRTKLDIKLVLESDDDETREAIEALDLPPNFRTVVVPDAMPKTKPKACNYGLLHAQGEIVVIYDAEDRPEPDQLKKVVVAFAKTDPDTVCVQCKLNFYNRHQNVLTRWFTTEYSMWFDVFLPGLDAHGAPIPLGGTSNHFLKDRLLELGAWDPFNVTEDADLGIRLCKAGLRTAMVDSTTFEEANSDINNWLRQRSRWVKGYIQTWLVHMRHPVALIRVLGTRRWFSFQAVVGGTFFTFLLNPVYWALTTIWTLTEAGVIQSAFPSFIYYMAGVGLFGGNFLFAYLTAAGAARRRHYDLVRYALFAPIYWGMMSIAAWKGAIQLITRPHYWEKTVHGLETPAGRR